MDFINALQNHQPEITESLNEVIKREEKTFLISSNNSHHINRLEDQIKSLKEQIGDMYVDRNNLMSCIGDLSLRLKRIEEVINQTRQ